MNEPFIRQRGAQLFTTSIDVAEKFGKAHRHVLESIRKIIIETSPVGDIKSERVNAPKTRRVSKVPVLKTGRVAPTKTTPVNQPTIGGVDFGKQNFRATTYMDDKGERRPMFEMTRSGFTILAMGFTGKVALEWKIKYEQAFSAMERALSNQQNLSWQDQRRNGKLARREVTDTIKAFISYAELQGSKNAHHYYKHVTHAAYKALFIVKDQGGKSFRDLLDSMQLSFLTTAEYIAAKAIEDGMDSGMPYKDIYKLAKERIETAASAMPKTKVVSDHAPAQRLPFSSAPALAH